MILESIALCEARCERAIAPENSLLRAPFTNLTSQHWPAYPIRITDPSLELPLPCGADLVPGALSDLRQGQTGNLGVGGGTVYFPVAFVHETSGSEQASCSVRFGEGLSFAFRLRAEMIPLLADANECQSDPVTRLCRVLR